MCACAIDIGTGFLVAAHQDDNQQILTKSIRNAFIDLENNDFSVKNMLSMSKINFIESDDKLYILGDAAVTLANIFKKDPRRPLSKGVLSAGEVEAEKIVYLLIENILGRAKTPGEICYYSVPGVPVDRDIDIIYHQSMFSKIIGSLGGYKAIALNESAAIVYSNCAKEKFSALALSFGCGMVNVALLYQTVICMSFSISGSGDWIDESASKAVGSTPSRLQFLKERGINLLDPNDGDPKTLREREALIIYYKSLILRVLDTIKNEFFKHKGIELPESIPMILSGGTALAKGFKELFESGFNTVKDKFPIPISGIRMASSPLESVAQGLLVAALNYNEGMKKNSQ